MIKTSYKSSAAGICWLLYIITGKEKQMLREDWTYKRGDIYLADLGSGKGSEQSGVRPVIVIQNDVGNYYSPNITIVPLTSKVKKTKQPTHYELVNVKGLDTRSLVLGECVDTISKQRVIRYLGKLRKRELKGVEEAVKAHLGFYLPESIELP